MTPFTVFYFEGTSFDPTTLEARFRYSFDHLVYFEERIDFSAPGFAVRKDIDPVVLANLLFHCSIAFGISYYKLYPTKRLVVSSGKIDDFQAAFWKKFYLQGLGEFLYKNQISPEGLFDFVGAGERTYEKKSFEVSQAGEDAPEYLV
ncbi:MAG: hypothetical protein PHH70_00260, partial [Candidatus Gracilibacteria bacterium]|nr:hypothetical protein [Candidatus Gracilibacteria bacterium]